MLRRRLGQTCYQRELLQTFQRFPRRVVRRKNNTISAFRLALKGELWFTAAYKLLFQFPQGPREKPRDRMGTTFHKIRDFAQAKFLEVRQVDYLILVFTQCFESLHKTFNNTDWVYNCSRRIAARARRAVALFGAPRSVFELGEHSICYLPYPLMKGFFASPLEVFDSLMGPQVGLMQYVLQLYLLPETGGHSTANQQAQRRTTRL